MYKIIGADGAEYGPVTADQVRLWIAEGRANAHTKVQMLGGTGWVELGSLPEFADALAANPPHIEPSVFRPPTEPVEVPLDRDYVLNIDECISRGWELLQNNFSVLFVASLIYLLIEFGIGLLGAIPFVGPVFSLANAIVVGPLLGGLFWV
ncbi:MAG: GYF domain-containing protein [Verrucomicrobiia bacterium]